jgi:hypothetical protein
MPPTIVRGAETTANVNTGQHVRDVASRLRYLDPEATPFTNILRGIASESADNFKYEWGEKVNAPDKDAVNGTTGTGTSIVVDNSAYFRVGNLVKVPRTGEVMRVTAINTGTETLTVVRAVGSTTVAAVADNDDLFIIGTAFAEGSAKGAAQNHQETIPFNYTQIFKTDVAASRTQTQTKSYWGNNRTRQRKEAAKEHKLALERSFIFGERNRDITDTAAPRNYTGGVLYFATANPLSVGGTLTEPEVWTWAEDLFAHTAAGETRTLLASGLWCSTIDLLAASRLQTVPGSDKTYGIGIRQWITSHGTLLVIKHRMLVDGAEGEGYGDYALALAMRSLKFRFLQNTMLKTDVQNPGDDGWQDEYLTEAGLELSNPELHGVGSGLTG